MVNHIGRRGAQLRPAEIAALMQRINSAAAGGSGTKKPGFLDNSVPSVANPTAFRQYGEALLRTNSSDKTLVKTRIREWLGLAGSVFPKDPAIDTLIPKLQKIVGDQSRLSGRVRNWDW